MTEWGSMALVDTGQGDDGTAIALPGVKKGDHSSRFWKPEIRVYSLHFSPTGRSWVACTTEGLQMYSLDQSLLFDPFDLEIDITPENVKKTLSKGEYSAALMLSFRLNEQSLIQEVLESIPKDNAATIIENLPDIYIDKLLSFVATLIENSAHIEFYLLWLLPLLSFHGPKLKQRSQQIMASLRALQKNVTRKYDDLRKIADHNKYATQYLLSLSNLRMEKSVDNEDDDGVRNLSDDDQNEELSFTYGSSDSDESESMDIS